MEAKRQLNSVRFGLLLVLLGAIAIFSFLGGFLWSSSAHAKEGKPRVVYPKNTELDFEGTQIEGELKNPAEFYFKRRPEEKFDSLVKRRKNFHSEMLRDVVLSK